ncbi:MAG: ferredoxin [Candidatus Norongarragalinales archaeon]
MAKGEIPFVDKAKCIGSGMCAIVASKTFKVVDGKSTVIEPQGDSEENIQAAIDGCPAQAIFWKKKQ